MKTHKIILEDYCDQNVQDLIVFEEEVDEEEIAKIINNIQKEKQGDYMFDDVIEAIEKQFKIKTEYDLYSTTIFRY